jgi:hypothetical protein
MFRRINLTAVFLISAALSMGCGGGGGAAGSGAATNVVATAQLATQNAPALVDGAATIDLVKTWNQWVQSGYRRDGTLNIYWQKDWGNMAMNTSIATRDLSNQRTTLTVTHALHGAHTGDQVTWSNLSSSTLHGLPKTAFEKTHTVTYLDDNSYTITVAGVATGLTPANFTVKPVFKYQECTGTQRVLQGPGAATTPGTFFNGFEALKSLSTNSSQLNNCSPAQSSLTSEKYFKSVATGLMTYLGEEIDNGPSTLVDTFVLPTGLFKSGDQGSVGSMVTYTNRSRAQIDSRTQLSYRVLKHTTSSVFLTLISEIKEDSGLLRATQTDLYGVNPATTGNDYVLMRSTVVYNNARKTEVVIDYSANFTEINPPRQGGAGALNAAAVADQPWTWFAIDVTPYLFGGEMQIVVQLGGGNMDANIELTASPPDTPIGPPVGTLSPRVQAMGVTPGSKTTLTYKLTNNLNGTYYLGVQGANAKTPDASNTFLFDAWIKDTP